MKFKCKQTSGIFFNNPTVGTLVNPFSETQGCNQGRKDKIRQSQPLHLSSPQTACLPRAQSLNHWWATWALVPEQMHSPHLRILGFSMQEPEQKQMLCLQEYTQDHHSRTSGHRPRALFDNNLPDPSTPSTLPQHSLGLSQKTAEVWKSESPTWSGV